MTIVEIVRLIVRYFHFIAGTAILLAFLVFYSTKDGKKEYSTHTLLNTGLISGYSIESNASGRVDYAKTNNELENLINLATSYETNKELSARLMAHLLLARKKGVLRLLPENLDHFEQTLKNLEINITDQDTEISIYQKLVNMREADQFNEVYLIANSKNDFFGIEQLENLVVTREGNSDMIRMEYTSIDPYISQKTLELLTGIFMSKQKGIKEGQSDSVIGFFEQAVNKSSAKLKGAEDALLQFRVNNKIINYYEQTRFISGNKEELDKQYQDELKILAGAKSALAKIEIEISDRDILASLQTKLANNRGNISKYSAELASLELTADTVPNQAMVIRKSELNLQIDSLKSQMTNIANDLLFTSQTPDGLETREMLTQWLNFTIMKEESAAKLSVMEARQQEYERIYDRFAPLGSTLKRLEREIDVAEREYLENLHSYNQARLHKYSMMMSSNIKVIDAPYYPIKPLKSKRMMMVILAFLVGAILPTAIIIASELMDNSLKKPETAKVQTGLYVGGILAKNTKKLQKSIDMDSLDRLALNLFVQELRANAQGVKEPKTVIFFSTEAAEGKSYIIEQLEKHFPYLNSGENPEFIFKELPSILHNPYSEEEVASGNVHVLVARANRRWMASDKHVLKIYRKLANKKPLLFINAVTAEVMEEVIGEIPKKRSWLRARVKQVLTTGFKTNSI
ncbi:MULTISPECIES: GNVR domain-containing protein [Roseivirga]|uniref:Tyrosine-protein kinase G-rich domain-containing protein n=1 Tax=Roseivirga thermotolerans TaxID=1758176 RepID=A0ABQ3IDM9_9BACT|nr:MULTISPECIES: GNVR domain-containing protein [Roseivirga]MEC7755394.1 GNVR domain-containing protein [Bacteroidota bacterium]GHE73366.1 hypothetical protein GCM10011340_32440 [Roseivirga thermotolerans]|tara:strand:- start:1069 stop:3132 length:2064 start_codon:yes stop_codon:yes gene_type:complete